MTHANDECPSGTFALDLSYGHPTLCVSYYTGKISINYIGEVHQQRVQDDRRRK
ncbi:MAG: hypothetical protein R2849_14950 [Thermomicrobiales bacterium]